MCELVPDSASCDESLHRFVNDGPPAHHRTIRSTQCLQKLVSARGRTNSFEDGSDWSNISWEVSLLPTSPPTLKPFRYTDEQKHLHARARRPHPGRLGIPRSHLRFLCYIHHRFATALSLRRITSPLFLVVVSFQVAPHDEIVADNALERNP